MTSRVAPTILSLAGACAACAGAAAEAPLSLEASSELRLQPDGPPPPPPTPLPASLPPRRAWEYSLDFIFWWPFDAGLDATARDVLAAIDAKGDNFIDEDETYAPQARFEAWSEMGWGIELSTTYYSLSANGSSGSQGGTQVPTLIDTDLEWWYIDLSAGFRLIDSPADSTGFGAAQVDFLAGLRYAQIDIEHTAQSTGQQVSDDDDYIEPIFGLRANVSIRDGIWWMTRLDMSGFTGTDLTWMIDSGIEYELADRVSLLFGYRVQNIDFEDGSGASRFGLDGTIQGPYLGLNLAF